MLRNRENQLVTMWIGTNSDLRYVRWYINTWIKSAVSKQLRWKWNWAKWRINLKSGCSYNHDPNI